jgi:serine protease Do
VHSAEVVGSDPLTDIAVIRIDAGTQIGATRHDNFADVEQGDLVFAFGSPLDFRFSMSSGLVSGMGRSAGIMSTRRRAGYEDFIQVDAAINPGNSGGPLTDARGRVIGMNTAIATDVQNPDGTGRFSGIGLAIPLPMIESVVQQLLDTGEVRKGFLGISVVEPSNALGELGGRQAPAGIVVTGAAFTGIKKGDVILRCGDTRVLSEDVLRTAWRDDEDGVVELEILNLATLQTNRITVTMPDAWPADDMLVDANTPFHEFIAMHNGPVGGVVVTWCQKDSAADRCGLVAGDVILRIEGRDIRTVEQLRSTISSVPPGRPITLETWRWTDPGRTSRRSAMLTDHPRADR